MSAFVLRFPEIDKSKLALVGGKGANLGELSRIDGLHVPAGFCVTTEAFASIMAATPALGPLLGRLSALGLEDRTQIGSLCAELRDTIEAAAMPENMRQEILLAHSVMGENAAYAVRSSATAEDLPQASFAGQQDSYLNIIGGEAILRHVSKCWASLYTDRAVIYRIKNGFDHRHVQLAVVVQKMVFPQASGILFTADPVTSNRKVLSIDAGFGLGEALVSGLVSPDCYKVRDGVIVEKTIATKNRAVYGLSAGGTETRELAPEQQQAQVLTDAQILELARTGRRIEAHFGSEQDIEWCLADETLYIVQSRPITTLFPLPEVEDQENHVYMSVGHQQMMTDPIKPLGLSLYLLISNAAMHPAGGRLFVDCTPSLASPMRRPMLLNIAGKADPLSRSALESILAREGFIKTVLDAPMAGPVPNTVDRLAQTDTHARIENDPTVVPGLIERAQAALAASRQNIRGKSGPELMDAILEDIQEMKKFLHDPQSLAVIMLGINASAWVNEKMQEWLGEKNVADTLTLSVPDNITSQMGLALLDVADAIRPYPAVIAHLQEASEANFWSGLASVEGGRQAREALSAFLDKYGMRCPGEIDIANPRWSEKPTTLVPMILSHVKNFGTNENHRKFEQLKQEALQKENDLLQRLKALPEGEAKAIETKQQIDRIRKYSGYREYPKYVWINYYFIYKQALLDEAERLLQAGVLQDKEDIYYLSFAELHEVLRTQKLDQGLINQRKAEYRIYAKLTPPRVSTSEGEVISGKYGDGAAPEGALTGIPVSTGIVEGRARVVYKLDEARIEEGDILVTPFTDPGWTPLFVSIKGLVTEVGGTMTHGAVVAREYGLPAVVSVERATRLIKDGQRIRVNGTQGYVEIL